MNKSRPVKLVHASSPRAAAIAGILFAILFAASIVLIRLSVPDSPTALSEWTDASRSQIGLALKLMPFAGIAFLWFVGVVRDRMGEFEDKFFSTVTLGSGLVFLVTSFMAMSIAAGMLAVYPIVKEQTLAVAIYSLNQTIYSQIFNTYGLKMAGVFMISISTLWLRTGVMPRWLATVTYLLALTLMVIISLSLTVSLIFPAWVLVVSVLVQWSRSSQLDE